MTESLAGWITALVAVLAWVSSHFIRQGVNARAVAELRRDLEQEREDRQKAIKDARESADAIARAVHESLDRRFDEIENSLRELREDVRGSNSRHQDVLVERGRAQAERDESRRRIDRLENLLMKGGV